MSDQNHQVLFFAEDPIHAIYIERCLQLAILGSGFVAPNPLVGAVLVCRDRIIGEGYHEQFGGSHAEVNCIHSVQEKDKLLIPESTLYVSLEPCAHTGKTPPCADLIIREKIPRVVIGCRDTFPEVDGKGIEKLQSNGVLVLYPVLENKCLALNKRFMTFHSKRRPYIVLKWAQSANGKIAGENGKHVLISNDYSNRIVHKWRTEEAGIMIGSKTAASDNPQLTSRYWEGKNPVRIVLDRNNKLSPSLQIFDRQVSTIILNSEKDSFEPNLQYRKIKSGKATIEEILNTLYEQNVLSILVEGGAKLLNLFFDSTVWDELRVITNNDLQIANGLEAPEIKDAELLKKEEFFSDSINFYKNIRSKL
jgi:diaminohydroxyphosphoribosylaminopyrimidine deaminase / 5-amino-6-(5-phosphoribosylamino)uracil reductase